MASKGNFEGAAVVSFRGHPLTDTPIKSKLPVRNTCNQFTKKETKPQINKDQISAVTNENTKLNSQRSIKIESVRVLKGIQRPSSPSAHFRDRKPPLMDRPRTLSSTPSPPTSRSRKVFFQKEITHSDSQEEPLHPPYYDTTFPLKSCINPKVKNYTQNPFSPLLEEPSERDNFVIVQKFIYPEDLPATLTNKGARKKK